MTVSQVRTRRSASRDPLAHADYIAQESSLEFGERFLLDAEKTFNQLAHLPQMGSSIDSKNAVLADVRKWQVSKRFRNHLIFYRPLPDGIDVLFVFHAARNYQEILESVKRLPS